MLQLFKLAQRNLETVQTSELTAVHFDEVITLPTSAKNGNLNALQKIFLLSIVINRRKLQRRGSKSLVHYGKFSRMSLTELESIVPKVNVFEMCAFCSVKDIKVTWMLSSPEPV